MYATTAWRTVDAQERLLAVLVLAAMLYGLSQQPCSTSPQVEVPVSEVAPNAFNDRSVGFVQGGSEWQLTEISTNLW